MQKNHTNLVKNACTLFLGSFLFFVSCAQQEGASTESTKSSVKFCDDSKDKRVVATCMQLGSDDSSLWQEVYGDKKLYIAAYTSEKICEKNPYVLPINDAISVAKIRVNDAGEVFVPASAEDCEISNLKTVDKGSQIKLKSTNTAPVKVPATTEKPATSDKPVSEKPATTEKPITEKPATTNKTTTVVNSDTTQKTSTIQAQTQKPAVAGTITLTVDEGKQTYFKIDWSKTGSDLEKEKKACVLGSLNVGAKSKTVLVSNKPILPYKKVQGKHLGVTLAESICDFPSGTKGYIFVDHFVEIPTVIKKYMQQLR